MGLNPNRPASSAGARSTTERLADTARVHPDKQDQLWKERVWKERKSAMEWEETWRIKEIHHMGPFPNNLSVFSDCIPNTTNQVYGSRLNTPLGDELLRQERLTLWPAGQRKRKPDPELLPF
ncbi:ciliary microtubule inner protein 5 [Oreochromis niloticus]|uniref:Uncharacterized protein n=1 Tax=Oreochromis niloticus TaxID=8128 RepID=A0A669CX83_ORENI|nr:uncharacterized protein C2orf50 homolog [Oreochromis niloticus]